MRTNFLNIYDLLLIFTALECCVLAVLLNLLPAKQIQPRRILSALFLLIALVLATTVIVWNGDLNTIAINRSPFVVTLLSACLLLQGPVLYFYICSLEKQVKLLRWRNSLHLVPALIAVILLVVFNVNSIEWQSITEWVGAKNAAVAFVWALVKLSPLAYIIGCVIAIYKLRDKLQHLFANISMFELKCAAIVFVGFCLHWLWSLLTYALEGWLSESVSDFLGVINNYLTVMLVNVFCVFGLINARQLLSVLAAPTAKPVQPKPIQPTKIDHKVELIEKAIHQRKLFLESNINLERFAKHIGLKSRDVSAILKMHYQSNFFEFINRYRVEEAKRLLLLPELKDETILEIIYKSGFNSPSAFHRFFKRMVGVTPTEYRQRGGTSN